MTKNEITTSTVCTKQFTSFQIAQMLTLANNVITQEATGELDGEQVLTFITSMFIY